MKLFLNPKVKIKNDQMEKIMIHKASSIWVLLGILLATLLSSCTTDMRRNRVEYIEKSYETESFTKIKFEGGYNIKLIQGDKNAFVMNTSEVLHDKVRIWVDNEMLYVKTKVNNIGTDEIKLTITVNNLESIKIEGGVFLTTVGFLELKEFDLEVEGGANIDMKINSESFRAKASGGVNMELEGTTNLFTAISEGAGNIDADHFEAKIVDCRVAGVGNASVYATEKLDAKVEGLGKIGYRGNPEITKQVNGIGMVYRK
jgi:hypothetical protein